MRPACCLIPWRLFSFLPNWDKQYLTRGALEKIEPTFPINGAGPGIQQVTEMSLLLLSSNAYTHASFPSLFLLSEPSHLGFLPSSLLPIHRSPPHTDAPPGLESTLIQSFGDPTQGWHLSPWPFICDSFLLRFFTCGSFLKSLLKKNKVSIEFVTILLLFFSLFFLPRRHVGY